MKAAGAGPPARPAEGDVATFASLGLSETIVAATSALGYEEPTPVQREAIPLLLAGRDLLAQAATGTGKTAAFALPMLQRIGVQSAGKATTRGLVLVPTRELAMQVSEAVHKYAKGGPLQVVPIYGGASMELQLRALHRGVDVVVATPGRALDHVRRGTLDLNTVELLVLDEADEMLDMGFAEELEAIVAATPATRQTALFSATIPARIAAIAQKHMRDPARIVIARDRPAAGKSPRVRQVAYIVARAHKPLALGRVLDMESPSSALVFCRTRLEVEELVETLTAHGYRAEGLHGGMPQKLRDRVMGLFRAGKADLLVATDVAARGLDIAHLSHVVNYDVPASPEAYVHRIGRTGRIGREGVAITLAEPREHRLLRNIEFFTKARIEVSAVPTTADLRSRRLDLMRATLRERLLLGDSDDVRVVVESLAGEFDVVQIAAAAVKLALDADGGDKPEQEIPAPPIPRPAPASPRPFIPGKSSARRGKGPDGPTTTLWIGAGREAGVRPADLVGAIAGEAGVPSRVIGSIQITGRYSVVEVPADLAEGIADALRKTTIRGRRVTVKSR